MSATKDQRKHGLQLEIKDETRGEVTAVFSTFDVIDHDGDVTRPGAFQDGAEVRISAYGHTSWDGVLPVGKGTIRQTRTEAIMSGRFFLDTQHGHDTFKVVQHMGGLQEWSYGFRVLKESQGDFNGRRVRFLERLAVDEVSPVMLGAGIGTRTLSAKSATEGPPAAPDGLDDETRDYLRWLYVKTTSETLAAEARGQLTEEQRAVMRKAAAAITSWYVEVSPGDVPAPARVLAEGAVADACIRLKHTPMPVVRWFRPESQAETDYMEIYGAPALSGFGWMGDIRGKADHDSNTVWLRTDQHGAGLYATAAHEVAHLAGADEAQAQAFETLAGHDYRKRVSPR